MKLLFFCITAILMVSFLSASANKSHFNNEKIAVVTTFDNLKGKWQRKEDGMHIWTLNDDGSYSQIYNNETQVSGKWGIYSETKDNGGKADANGTFLWLTAADGQVYCYKIEDMTATTFKLKNQTILYEFVKM